MRRVHPGVKDESCAHRLLMQPIEHTVDERSFAGSDFATQQNESLASLNSVHQAGQRFFDRFRQKQIARVRVDVERTLFESIKTLVHGLAFDHSRCWTKGIQQRAAPWPRRFE